MPCYVVRIFLLLLFPLAALANHVRQWKIIKRLNERTNEMNDLAWYHKRLMATAKPKKEKKTCIKFNVIRFFYIARSFRHLKCGVDTLFFFLFLSRRFLICHWAILKRHSTQTKVEWEEEQERKRGRKKNGFEEMKKK